MFVFVVESLVVGAVIIYAYCLSASCFKHLLCFANRSALNRNNFLKCFAL